MKKLYITPTLKSVVLEERLLETISGSNQGWGDMGAKRIYSDFDYETEDTRLLKGWNR